MSSAVVTEKPALRRLTSSTRRLRVSPSTNSRFWRATRLGSPRTQAAALARGAPCVVAVLQACRACGVTEGPSESREGGGSCHAQRNAMATDLARTNARTIAMRAEGLQAGSAEAHAL